MCHVIFLFLKRFTGNQIAKIFQRKSTFEAYKKFDSTEVLRNGV